MSTSNESRMMKVRIELLKAMDMFSVNNTPGEAFFVITIGKNTKKVKIDRSTVNLYIKPSTNILTFYGIEPDVNIIDIEFHNKEKNKPIKIYKTQI